MESRGGSVGRRAGISLYGEARTESGDLAPRSHTTGQECEPQGQERKKKRKHSCGEQQRCVKRARRPVAQPTPLTVSALKSVQDEPENFVNSKDSQASRGQVLSRCNTDYDQWSHIMSCKNGARSVSDYSDSRRKGSASLLSSKSKSVTAYDVDFDDILEARRVVEAGDEEPNNWRELQSLVGRDRASAPPEEHEIKRTIRRSSNENSVSSSVFPRIFPVTRVDTCQTLKEQWNRQWAHWIPPYQNHDPKLAPPQPDYAIGYHTKLFPCGAIRRLQGLASPSKNKLSFPIFFAELKGSSGAMNVAKLQNLHNGASAVYNLLRLYQALSLEDDFYDKAWVLALDTNGEMWRLRCHWVSKGGHDRDTYYSKVLRCWAVEDPRDSVISEVRASMRNIVDWMRDVLFKDLSATVDTYDTFNTRPKTEDASIPLASDHSFVNETQSIGFGTQPNRAFSSQRGSRN